MIVATPPLTLRERMRSSCGRPVSGSGECAIERAHRNPSAGCPCFSLRLSLYSRPMNIMTGWGSRMRGLFADSKGPWGSNSAGPGSGGSEPPSDDGHGGGSQGGSQGPWGEAPRRRRSPIGGPSNVTSLDDLLRRGRARFGGGRGGGTGLPGRPDRSLIFWAVVALICLYLIA